MSDPVADAVAALQRDLLNQQQEKLGVAQAAITELGAQLAVRQQEAAIAQATIDQILAFASWQQTNLITPPLT